MSENKDFIVKRLSAVNLVDKISIVDYALPVTPDSPFVVDDSAFCPMSEAVKQLAKVPQVTSDEVKQYYDFADGRDTGKKVPFERSSDFKDITELSNNIIEETKNIVDTIESTKKKIKRQELLESVAGSVKPPSGADISATAKES